MENVVTIYPPNYTGTYEKSAIRIFLAGSIEMNKASDWQSRAIEVIKHEFKTNYYFTNAMIFNPRRPDWNSEWGQSMQDAHFYQQVDWELTNLERATHIILFFEKGTQSPISLLELGLYAKAQKPLVVVCEDGFHRKGNVEMVCNRYRIPMQETLESGIKYLIYMK